MSPYSSKDVYPEVNDSIRKYFVLKYGIRNCRVLYNLITQCYVLENWIGDDDIAHSIINKMKVFGSYKEKSVNRNGATIQYIVQHSLKFELQDTFGLVSQEFNKYYASVLKQLNQKANLLWHLRMFVRIVRLLQWRTESSVKIFFLE